MTVAVVTPMWGRFEIVRLAQEQLALACAGQDIERWIVGSEGDVSAGLAADVGAHYLEHPNQPLSNKQNAIVQHVIARDHVTGIIFIGSDNLLTPTAVQSYLGHASQGADVVGYLDGYRYLSGDLLTYWSGYVGPRGGESTGCRYYSKRVIEKVGGNLWEPGMRKGLDRSATIKIQASKPAVVTMRQGGQVLMAGVEWQAISKTHLTELRVKADASLLDAAFGDIGRRLRAMEFPKK